MSKSLQRIIQQSADGGMFSNRGLGRTIRERLIPRELREDLRKQWQTAAHSSSNVHLRYVDKNTGQDWFVTGWDGYDSLAGYTNSGFRNIAITEIINKKAVIDDTWDPSITLAEVKQYRPCETHYNDKFASGYKDRSHYVFTEMTRNIIDEDEELEGSLLTVFYDKDTWQNDIALAVNMLEDRESEVYEGDEDAAHAYVFSYDNGTWTVSETEPGDTINENEFILVVSDNDIDSAIAPTEDDLIEAAMQLPSPLLESVNHYDPDVEVEQDYIVAMGSSIMEHGVRAYLASDGLPHGMMPVSRVSALSEEEALEKVSKMLGGRLNG